MRNPLRQAIPSMFHRRLLLLIAAVLCVAAILLLQMINLTVASSGAWRERAESALTRSSLIGTVRGRVLDRNGRVLAMDRPSYDVAVHYSVISGRWAYERAARAARSNYDGDWFGLDSQQRELQVQRALPAMQDQVDDLWATLAEVEGVLPEEIEERRMSIVRKVQRMVTHVWDYRRRRAMKEKQEAVPLSEVAGRLAEQNDSHAVIQDIRSAQRFELARRIHQNSTDRKSVWRHVSIIDSQTRRFPMENITLEVDRDTFPSPIRNEKPLEVTVNGVAIHMIGSMRRMWANDKFLEDRPFSIRYGDEVAIVDFGGYREGDIVGAWGIERAYEDELRGLRGEIRTNLETREEFRRDPQQGSNIALSIDLRLQARIAALMSHDAELGLTRRQKWHVYKSPDVEPEPLNGTAVVLDIPTGEILAAVTVPSFSRAQLEEEPASFWRSKWAIANRPRVFRPIATPYPPGSTIKPILLASAYSGGKLSLNSTIDCQGALDMENPTKNRCWIFKLALRGHGPLDGAESIRRSCNVFYYTLGQRFGPRELVRWYSKFGMGSPTDCGLPAEHAGRLPSLDITADPSQQGLEMSHAIQMGIGQGPVEWTPIQAANAYATIARGGVMIRPTFVKRPVSEAPTFDLKLNKAGLKKVMSGMDMAVNMRHGTSYMLHIGEGEEIFNIQGVKVVGKSGTADPGARWIDYDLDRKVDSDELTKEPGDHAWFVGIVTREGEDKPRFIVAVVLEYAGSGGAASGPVANQILHALRAEGYL